MAKRFVDTALWGKPWFRKLPPIDKAAWFYILSHCDAVGVWDADFELAEFSIGGTGAPEWDSLIKKSNGNIEVLPNGKWWLRDFCDFQYGLLSSSCKPHNYYLNLLGKHGLTIRDQRVCKGYAKGIHTLKEKEKEKELEKEKERDWVGVRGEGVAGPVDKVIGEWEKGVRRNDPTRSDARIWIERRLGLAKQGRPCVPQNTEEELCGAIRRYGSEAKSRQTEFRYAIRNFFGSKNYCEVYLSPDWTPPSVGPLPDQKPAKECPFVFEEVLKNGDQATRIHS